MLLKFESFYSTFFEKLLENNLLYAVVRNYEGLPFTKPGGDVDILIEKKKIDTVINLINEILAPVNGRIEITSTHYYVVKLKLHNVTDNLSNEPVTELDLITKLSVKGRSWLSESEVLNNTILYKDSICIPTPRHELLMSLFHSLLFGGFVKERYCKQMDSLFLISDKNLLKKDLINNFGESIGKLIFNYIEESDWKSLKDNVKKFRQALTQINLRKNIINTYAAIISHYYLEIIIRIKRIWRMK